MKHIDWEQLIMSYTPSVYVSHSLKYLLYDCGCILLCKLPLPIDTVDDIVAFETFTDDEIETGVFVGLQIPYNVRVVE